MAQRRIGLTGGIATGKSSVGRWLSHQGLTVLDADQYARQALEPGTQATAAVFQRFGSRVRHKDGDVIDRVALGDIVFNDPRERRWLELLLHPLVRERFTAELIVHESESTVILMIPLLFESGLQSLCNEVWLVDCDESQQIERLMIRDGLTLSAAKARIVAQWPLSQKRLLADRLISNHGQPEAWIKYAELALGSS